MEGETLNLQILRRPLSINSPEQTLKIQMPAAIYDCGRWLHHTEVVPKNWK
jgi:hypothetical protein